MAARSPTRSGQPRAPRRWGRGATPGTAVRQIKQAGATVAAQAHLDGERAAGRAYDAQSPGATAGLLRTRPAPVGLQSLSDWAVAALRPEEAYVNTLEPQVMA